MSERPSRGRKRTPLIERFAARTERDPETGCLNFTGYVHSNGYGMIGTEPPARRRVEYAHRVAYVLAKGPIPAGLAIDHLCRNRRCCNPDHLEAVTLGVNVIRGSGITARNSRKTHCKRGHPFNEANTIIWAPRGRPWRSCKLCQAAKTHARAEARRQSRVATESPPASPSPTGGKR